MNVIVPLYIFVLCFCSIVPNSVDLLIAYLFDFTITGSLGATAGHGAALLAVPHRVTVGTGTLLSSDLGVLQTERSFSFPTQIVGQFAVVFSVLAKTVLQDPVIPTVPMLVNCSMEMILDILISKNMCSRRREAFFHNRECRDQGQVFRNPDKLSKVGGEQFQHHGQDVDEQRGNEASQTYVFFQPL